MCDDMIRLNGFYVGFLTESELEQFNKDCEEGLAERVYHPILGIAKVHYFEQEAQRNV